MDTDTSVWVKSGWNQLDLCSDLIKKDSIQPSWLLEVVLPQQKSRAQECAGMGRTQKELYLCSGCQQEVLWGLLRVCSSAAGHKNRGWVNNKGRHELRAPEARVKHWPWFLGLSSEGPSQGKEHPTWSSAAPSQLGQPGQGPGATCTSRWACPRQEQEIPPGNKSPSSLKWFCKYLPTRLGLESATERQL